MKKATKLKKKVVKVPAKKRAPKKRVKKNPGGRPTDFKKEYCEQAEKLCKLGATDKELADFFGVTEQTVNNWKNSQPKFFESIKAGKTMADANVADRLYQRAMGFEHDSEEIKVVSDGRGEGSSVERVPVRKIYPPDTVAAIFWLKNRQKDKWRDKAEVDHTTKGESINDKTDLSKLTTDELNLVLKAKKVLGDSDTE